MTSLSPKKLEILLNVIGYPKIFWPVFNWIIESTNKIKYENKNEKKIIFFKLSTFDRRYAIKIENNIILMYGKELENETKGEKEKKELILM